MRGEGEGGGKRRPGATLGTRYLPYRVAWLVVAQPADDDVDLDAVLVAALMAGDRVLAAAC